VSKPDQALLDKIEKRRRKLEEVETKLRRYRQKKVDALR
jgi:hypothetical protein